MSSSSPQTTDTPNTLQPNLLITGARVTALLAILAVGGYVALSPSVFYAPTPRVVLYLLASILPAILFGSEIAATFQWKVGSLIITAAGVFASILILLFFLTWLSKPQQQIAVFHIVDENNQPVANLDREGAIEIPLTSEGLSVTKFVDNNTVVLIFPEQVGECMLRVRPSSRGPTFSGLVRYSGNRETQLVLGKNLKDN